MNPRKTVEIKLSHDHSTVLGKEPRKTTTLNLQKPSCKNGICEVVWKPVKPAA